MHVNGFIVFLELCYMFMFGSILGYIIEVFFRRFFSAKRWINPGFLHGPYLPLYGTGLTLLYIVSNFLDFHIPNQIANDIITCIFMGILMTLIEYIAGIIFIKGFKVKLWDYSKMRWNIQGIICPLFSFFWLVICFIYFYGINPYMQITMNFFMTYSYYFNFLLGIFYGLFIFDFIITTSFFTKVVKLTKNSKAIISYEQLKLDIANKKKLRKEKFKIDNPDLVDFISKANQKANDLIGKIIYKDDNNQ